MRKISTWLALLFLCFGFFLGVGVETPLAAVNFNVSNDTLKSDIAKYSVNVTVNNSEQRFAIKASDITKFKVKSKKQTAKTVTVKSTVSIDREVATVKGSVTSTYKLTKNKWKLANVSYTSTAISSVPFAGTWAGTYEPSGGTARVEITIGGVTADGFVTDAVFSFSASPTNPSFPSGSYSLKGGIDKASGKVALDGDIWIDQPQGYSFANLHGYLDLVNKKMISTDGFAFNLSKM